MSGNSFIPQMKHTASTEPTASQPIAAKPNDATSGSLLRVAQYAVILMLGLTPVFFMPGLWASLGFDKVMLTIGLSVVVAIVLSLAMLRKQQAQTVLPLSLGVYWALFFVALVSGLLSGDSQDALRGSVMETQTVAFLGVLGLAMTAPLVLQGSKLMSIKALAFFGVTSVFLLVYNVIRLLVGGEVLQLGSFGAVTVSPVGGFNDLALFAGMLIILSLITLLQLPLKAWLQYLMAVLVALSLFIMAVVNFFNIWLVVGFFALLTLIYLLSRDTLFAGGDPSTAPNSRVMLATTGVVCVVSAIFIIAGDFAGNKMSALTNVDYIEVRPSAGATIDVARAVYADNLLFGIGPNRFADAWRQHKDPSINQTIFWDTDFGAGNGYIPTLFVTLGVLGGLLVVAFHVLFLYLGYRMLLRSNQHDSYWYYFGAVSFAAATFVWGMSYFYVPGAGILLLGALFTGFTFAAASALLPSMVRSIPLAVNRRRGFFLMAAVIVMITASVSVLFSASEQYVAQTRFAKAQVAVSGSQDDVQAALAQFELEARNAYALYPDERFLSVQAQLQSATISALLGLQNPTEEQQQQFITASQKAITYADQAITDDPTNPDYHALLAAIYGNLALAPVDGAAERADQSLATAKMLDPQNPTFPFMAAQMAARSGDVEKARTEIVNTLSLKRNFTQALYLSAQLDISEGKTESAIATTRAITTLEPNNPTRYFQLGVLFSANGSSTEAIAAYNAAITLDPQYANARYLLALALLNEGQSDLALEQLKVVAQTNQENEQLKALIAQVESGEFEVPDSTGFEAPVSEANPVTEIGETDRVITDGVVDTDLVSPVNTISSSDEAETASETEEETAADTEVVEDEVIDTEAPASDETENLDS